VKRQVLSELNGVTTQKATLAFMEPEGSLPCSQELAAVLNQCVLSAH
jgi:hypothetical protein